MFKATQSCYVNTKDSFGFMKYKFLQSWYESNPWMTTYQAKSIKHFKIWVDEKWELDLVASTSNCKTKYSNEMSIWINSSHNNNKS